MRILGHLDSRVLNEDTEPPDVTVSGREFHSDIVLGTNDCWYWVDHEQGMTNLCFVERPRTGL